MPRLREEIPAALVGERIDRVVAMLSELPRGDVAALIDAGEVAVDGAVVTKPSRRVRQGEVVELDVPDRRGPEPPSADPTIEFAVVHADDSVIVVDKPPHLVVHPGAGHRGGTLVSGLLARFPDMADLDTGDRERPGIVHRLDAGTSGLLVVARTPDAYEDLVEQLSSRSVERRYHTLVLGHVEPAAGVVDAPIGRSGGDKTRMAVTTSGREARTGYEVIRTYHTPVPTSEMHCRLETGRTHQIRVHFAAIGHPVVGDDRYGGVRPALPLDRPFLHAEELAFDHPVTRERVRFTSPLPRDLVDLLATLT
jgi:23S rRNA pseudouridine1911/1915/1917 synthase